MGFSDLEIDIRYRSSESDISRDFLIPVLSKAFEYKRAVGYFSSTSLIELSKGIASVAKRGGKIKFIVSPELSNEDIEAINKGYLDRNQVIENSLMRNFIEHNNPADLDRLNLLSHLISDGILDIKVAILEEKSNTGIYHEKIGILTDHKGNRIAFTGSLNESANAFINNFESIHVFNSFTDEARTSRMNQDFDEMWSNKTNKIVVLDFPKALKEQIFKYKEKTVNYDIDDYLLNEDLLVNYDIELKKPIKPSVPESIQLYDYQIEAIENWFSQKAIGIFDMATGTGKTFTALAGTVKLMEKLDYRLAVIVGCPFIHLVDQWAEEATKFNIEPIIGHSQSEHKNWRDLFKESLYDYNLGIIKNFFLFTTISTYRSKFVQEHLHNLKGASLFIADEAHNFGTEKLQQTLLQNFRYRMALSATISRYGDEEGTQALYDYFGKKCIEYDIDRAINEGKLSKYKYHPIVVTLTDDELHEYEDLTSKIARCIVTNNKGEENLSETGKMLAIKRARLIAGASNKMKALLEVMAQHENDYNMLVYCGTATFLDDNEEEVKQITKVCEILGNELNIRIDRYTARENLQERRIIRERFEKGDDLQALVAIKCLDEGVNIPGIKTAFILASSTNPREHIQRRGRVLRLHKNKDYAIIYDFITIPYTMEQAETYPLNLLRPFHSLINNEINRLEEFGSSSLNPKDADQLIKRLVDSFKINIYDISTFIEMDWGENYE